MFAVLRSLWAEPRPARPPARRWWDLALVAAIVVVAAIEAAARPDLPLRAVSIVMTMGLAPTLLWRRDRPLLMVAIVFVTCSAAPLLLNGQAPSMNTMVYFVLILYSLARWGSGQEIVIGVGVILLKIASLILVEHKSSDAVAAAAVLSAAIAAGAAFRYRARARVRELDKIKLLEREQLARDLHDTVAHHVSAMAIRAQAGLATSASRPDAATEALRVIEAEASQALREMRSMVRVLRRDEPADRVPGRRVDDLHQLAGRSGDGPSVDVRVAGDLGDLPPSVGAAIYRLAQESITNALRHARHATRVEVNVAADDTSVRLSVTDDGDPAPVRTSQSPGYGLVGMIERAGLLGGTCEAGPNPGRGWTVTAVLPRTGVPA